MNNTQKAWAITTSLDAKDVGKALRSLREDARLTGTAIGRELGMSARRAYAIESGDHQLRLSTILTYARACGYDVRIMFLQHGSEENNRNCEVLKEEHE